MSSRAARSAKVSSNAFVSADAAASIAGDLSGYPLGYELGLDVIKTEFPHFALSVLGRLSPKTAP